MLFLSMGFFYFPLHGQSAFTLQGKVLDENARPLTGASVLLYPAQRGAITDTGGYFVFDFLRKAEYILEISFLGYKTLTDTLILTGNHTYRVQLQPLSLSLQEVMVTDHFAETRKREESLTMEIVNEDYLKQNLGGSLMSSLERLPGVTSMDIGSGQSKPVIRGLGFARVVVVENSVKHEAQQWGADHGLEIDQYAVDNVEIIKGPSSLRYGSDALGGVIDMKNRKLPAPHSFGGSVDLTARTNNGLAGTSVSLYGRKNRLYAGIRATLSDYGDSKVPADSVDIYSYRVALHKNRLRNTAGGEQNLHVSFGLIQNRFHSKFFVSSVNSQSGFFANAHGLEPRNVDTKAYDRSDRDILFPRQDVHHFKLINNTRYRWETLEVESALGYQHNFRQEWSQYVDHGYMPAVFPDTLGFHPDLERQFDKEVYTGNVKVSFQGIQHVQLDLGLNSEYQKNRIDGRGFIIPSFSLFQWGSYAIASYALSGKSRFQAGIRYDFGRIHTAEYADWFPSPLVENGDTSLQYLTRATEINRTFSTFSGSVGYTFHPGKWLYKIHLGKSFRIPDARELAANGVNYHHFSYETGNPGLSPEVSYQLDAGLEYTSGKLAIGVSPFVNYFSNYIYLNPTSEHDRLHGNGNQVFNYTGSRVFRFGGELHSHFQLLKSLQLGVLGEYVYSEQRSGVKKGFTLPFSPPASAILNLKYQKETIGRNHPGRLRNIYVSADYRITARQHKIVPPEEPTAAYQLVHLSLGGDIRVRDQTVDLSLQVQNLLNTRYLNHTSYYRLIHLPEPGRNFIVNLSMPFSGKIKSRSN